MNWRIIALLPAYLLMQATVMAEQIPVEQVPAKQIPAKRIIALAPHIVEMLFDIGAGEQIIGTTEHSDYPEAAKEIPRIGNYARLNIEQVLASDPDLIIAWQSGNPSDDLERLEKLGLKIVYSQPVTLEDVAKELEYFAKLTGHQQQGRQQAQQFLSRLDELKEKYQDKTSIKVFYELWPRPLTTVANNAWPQQQLNVCRAENPFVQSPSDYPQINVEQVVLTAPDIIIQPDSSSMKSPDSIDWQQWQTIPAVANNAFIYPNADKLLRMTARSLDELVTLCQQIDEFRTVAGK